MSARRRVLARAAAARLVAAACRERSGVWNLQEQLHAEATTPAEASAAALPLLEICGGCPIVAECAAWAEVDSYTGIAAAAAWHNGQERPVDRVRQPPRRLGQLSELAS